MKRKKLSLHVNREVEASPALREAKEQRHERGPFELAGLPHGSLRRWYVYDSHGIIRIEKAMADRDVTEDFVDRLWTELDELDPIPKLHES